MKALNRKLARDLWRMRVQVVTVSLAVACGVTTFVASLSTWVSLQASRDATYRLLRFADVFGRVQRAPSSVASELRALDGVAFVEGRVSQLTRVEVPGFPELVRGQFISLPAHPGLDTLFLRTGRLPERSDEVVVNELFAERHGLVPGDELFATFGGRRVRLRLVGAGVSPDHLWVLGGGGGFGDERRFGIFWMREDALASALGLEGAFTDFAVSLAPGASVEGVKASVERTLAPWGSYGTFGRKEQVSSRLVDQEIGQLRGSATLLPVVFLGVAAFLVNVLLSRIVGLQREQIAALKAFGYRDSALAAHYLVLALVMVVPGAVAGLGFGTWVAGSFLRMYERFFRFPQLELVLEPRVLLTATLVSICTALLGALAAVRKVVRLRAAEAMRPEAPGSYRRTLLERLRLHDVVPILFRMVLRDLERQPLRTGLSALGIAAATAILVAGFGAFDSIEVLFERQFERVQREDLAVTFDRALPSGVVRSVASLPGVIRVERQRSVPVRLRSARASRESVLVVMRDEASLRRLVSTSGREVTLPAKGLVVSRTLARVLGLDAGDWLDVELLEGRRPRVRIPISSLVDDIFGLNAYMREAPFLEATLEPSLASDLLLRIDRAQLDALVGQLSSLPAVSGVTRPQVARELFRRQTAEVFLTYQFVLVAFAFVIAVGVVFNNARIALVSRSRDLASLRILGFSREQVGTVLLGEQLVQLGLGIPLGLPLGRWLVDAALSRTDPELYRLPATVSSVSMMSAAILVFMAGLVSTLFVRRGVRRMDLVGVLKARD